MENNLIRLDLNVHALSVRHGMELSVPESPDVEEVKLLTQIMNVFVQMGLILMVDSVNLQVVQADNNGMDNNVFVLKKEIGMDQSVYNVSMVKFGTQSVDPAYVQLIIHGMVTFVRNC